MIETCTHFIGLCGENHPSVLTFVLGHNEVHYSIQYLKYYFRKREATKKISV